MIQHKTLLRQLRKAGITDHTTITEENFAKFLKLVENTYNDHERDREFYESTSDKVSKEFQELNDDLNLKVKELEQTNKNIHDSIEYASLMQQAILPNRSIIQNFFADSFIYWKPKDIVGGDIYFFNLIDDDSILVMVIDGAGHGVSGGFLTMLVKAIEEQIMAKIKEKLLEPSPALILKYFNCSLKTMLQQTGNSKSNSGFDGGILYYNKQTKHCKYAGAKMPLYIIQDEEMKTIRSDRKSVGYLRTQMNQTYTEHSIEIRPNTKLYITTDGIPDQEGLNDKRFGIKRFKELILTNSYLPFHAQYKKFLSDFLRFKGEKPQSDDITALGLKF